MNEHTLKLLYEAFKLELLCRFIRGTEWLVDRNTHQPRNEQDQECFGFLLEAGLIEESDQICEDFDQDSYSCYRISLLGLKELSGANLDRDEPIAISHFEFSESIHHARWDGPWSVWECFEGRVFGDRVDAYGERIDSDPKIEVGKIEFFRLNVELYHNCGFDIDSDPICVNDALRGYAKLLEDKKGYNIPISDLSDHVSEPYETPQNILFLNHIQINPQYLGMGLGAQIIRRLFARYAPGGGICAIIPFPLQYSHSYDRAREQCPQFTEAERSLRAYYERIGFVQHPHDKTLMICSLSRSRLSKLPLRYG